MNTREWALVAFTLLMQTSVGVLLIVAVLHPFVSRGSVHGSARPLDLPLLAATGAAVLGLVASLAHLGQPTQAWLALTNLRASWLSREILLAVLFTASAILVAALVRTGTGSPAVRGAACVAAAVLGVAAVYAMSRLYMVPAQPAWNRVVTPVSFFATTIVLGAVVVVAISAGETTYAAGATRTSPLQARWLIATAIALLVVQLLLVPAQIAALGREPAAAISAASVGHTALWLAVGKALAALVAGILLVNALRGAPGLLSPATSVIATLVLVVVSEALGRVLFYASSVHLGPV
jgi:anaerobic dimethyl sulfoxide reductase subunit C (anchor subunit)